MDARTLHRAAGRASEPPGGCSCELLPPHFFSNSPWTTGSLACFNVHPVGLPTEPSYTGIKHFEWLKKKIWRPPHKSRSFTASARKLRCTLCVIDIDANINNVWWPNWLWCFNGKAPGFAACGSLCSLSLPLRVQSCKRSLFLGTLENREHISDMKSINVELNAHISLACMFFCSFASFFFPPIRWWTGCRVLVQSCWRLSKQSATRCERRRLYSRSMRRSRVSTA